MWSSRDSQGAWWLVPYCSNNSPRPSLLLCSTAGRQMHPSFGLHFGIIVRHRIRVLHQQLELKPIKFLLLVFGYLPFSATFRLIIGSEERLGIPVLELGYQTMPALIHELFTVRYFGFSVQQFFVILPVTRLEIFNFPKKFVLIFVDHDLTFVCPKFSLFESLLLSRF